MEPSRLTLASDQLVGFDCGMDNWIFADDSYTPSYWLILKRESFRDYSLDLFEKIDLLFYQFDSDALADIYRLHDPLPSDANTWSIWTFRSEIQELVMSGRIKVFNVSDDIAQRLAYHSDTINSDPHALGMSSDPIDEKRDALAEELGNDIARRWIGKDEADRLHFSRWILTQHLIETYDVGATVVDTVVDLVVGLKDIAVFTVNIIGNEIEFHYQVHKGMLSGAGHALTGDQAAAQDALVEMGIVLGKRAKSQQEFIDNVIQKAKEGHTMLMRLYDDPHSRTLMWDFFSSLYYSLTYRKQQTLEQRILMEVGIEVLLAIATGGAINAIRRGTQAAASTAKLAKGLSAVDRIGPFTKEAIQHIADLSRLLDKPALKTPEKPPLTIIPEGVLKKKPAGLHNQEMEVEVKRGSFKTQRQVDMDNLSEKDIKAFDQMKQQGWNDKKAAEVLSSGNNFRTKELKAGDKLYGFDTQGRSKDISTSAYWTDEAGFNSIKQQHYKDGVWDKEGVKNTLALPCYNRADSISMVEVTENTTAVQSTVGKASELIQYSDGSGYNTGMLGKIMPGGGTQATVDPSVLTLIGN